MAVRVQTLQNLQRIDAVVSGPDGANRLINLAGIMPVSLGAATTRETFTCLLGPTLSRRQFVAASGAAWFTAMTEAGPMGFACSIVSVDADWDDESGQVELRVEVSVANVSISGIGFVATILVEL